MIISAKPLHSRNSCNRKKEEKKISTEVMDNKN
jgi:hypothetical protein